MEVFYPYAALVCHPFLPSMIKVWNVLYREISSKSAFIHPS